MTPDAAYALKLLPEADEALIPSSRLPAYLGVAEQTLARWRHEGKGPAFIKVGRAVLYQTGQVREWLQANKQGIAS
ncbi:hypothetical protein GCM10007276_07010 [Agaricicola taiwanensis]|uniref:Helix-turn-helix domain-containing protein n=1 Tax=Agaricicola taiwanensis TaxID=591372 RepID=A0A8J2VMB2_9RHOB|nr:helix-turn-helix domain-containing protein [Agaricicola taiwanensis]GGE32362.1 hypothetical protein GCM10007276_07010 [Agaricicola taiwanensis]